MKRTIDLDADLMNEVLRTASLLHEKPATILRMALRAGLSSVGLRFQAQRPEGYFADAYNDSGRLQFEEDMAKAAQQKVER